MIAAIAAIDWHVDLNIAFGFLYILPLLLAGTAVSRRVVVLTALICTGLSDFFNPFGFTLAVALPQDILVFAALAGCGLFACEAQPARGGGPASGGEGSAGPPRGRRAA